MHALKKTFHIQCAPGDVGRYCILPGDPGRVPAIAALFDDDGMVITLMTGGKVTEVKYPRTFHIGFAQESQARVNEIYQQLKDDGFDVAPPQQSHAWTFYVQAPGGFLVEVLC